MSEATCITCEKKHKPGHCRAMVECDACEPGVLHEARLPHCHQCGEHHTTDITCEELANVRTAEARAWDPTP